MATFKTCVQKQRSDGFYPVYIRVTHNRKSSYIKTDKMVDKKGLTRTGEVKDPFVLSFCSDIIFKNSFFTSILKALPLFNVII